MTRVEFSCIRCDIKWTVWSAMRGECELLSLLEWCSLWCEGPESSFVDYKVNWR